MESVLKFTLNCSKEPVLILSKHSSRYRLEIDFTNDALASILHVSNTFEDIKQGIGNWDQFYEFALKSTSKSEFNLSAKKARFLRATFHHHENFIVVFVRNTYLEERRKCLEICDRLSRVRCVIGEYVPEIKDLLVKFCSTQTLNDQNIIDGENVYGKNLSDGIFNVPLLTARSLASDMEKIGPKNPVIPQERFPVGPGYSIETWIKPTLYYLGESSEHRKVLGAIGQDIGEQVALETELEQKKFQMKELYEVHDLLKALYDNANIFMGSVDIVDNDTDGVIVTLNPECSKYWGIENATGMRLSEIGFPEEIYKTFFRNIRCGDTGKMKEFSWRGKDGKLHVQSYITVPMSSNRYCFVATDMTETVELREELRAQKENLEAIVKKRTAELEEALEAKSRFLATISHEIRTPMNGLLGMISLLIETEMNDEQKEMLRVADVCGKTLLNVLNDILEFCKLEANRIILEKLEFNLETLIGDSIQILASEAEKKKLELVCDVDESVPPRIIGDSIRLRQILVNLLSNACKFSDNGDVIVHAQGKNIEKRDSEGRKLIEIEFKVSDEGIGISEEAKQRILSPFMQADISTSRKFGGTGLGLVICKHLAELMDGKLWFESKEGIGSTFYFTIIATVPVASDIDNVQAIMDKEIHAHVAVISKSRGLRNAIKKKLQDHFSVTVDLFGSGFEFLENPNRNYQCVLADKNEITDEIKEIAGNGLIDMAYPPVPGIISKPIRKCEFKNLGIFSTFSSVPSLWSSF